MFKFLLLFSHYKHYFSYFIVGTILCVPYPLYGQTKNILFIGTNAAGALGYLNIKAIPINQLYTTLDIKDIHCSGFIKGYTERQVNRFIIHTDVPDPRKDEKHQCQVTFVLKDQKLQIIKEENCTEWHALGCSFTSLQFSPAPTPLSGK